VSDFWTAPSKEEEAASRRRALWGLSILAAVAVLVVALMLVLPGKFGNGRGGAGLAATSSTSQPAPQTTALAPTATGASTPTSSTASGRPTQTSTANPCPSTAACVVAGDDGGVVAALNAFRAGHGRSAVPGAVTAQAGQCALSQGDGPSCAPHYAWQPVSARDGAKVITMIASRSEGMAWLLDPAMTSFSVGWAYQPSGAGGPGQYECAILKSR
jgi:hypothetical protein